MKNLKLFLGCLLILIVAGVAGPFIKTTNMNLIATILIGLITLSLPIVLKSYAGHKGVLAGALTVLILNIIMILNLTNVQSCTDTCGLPNMVLLLISGLYLGWWFILFIQSRNKKQ
ncbi:MAG: hypothetical protein K0S38_869 [Candidatus Paceibacter sp.]|jgi:hypothetical protein|nr:hypothetical protein [Candidatus Paceibacter sp.]